MSKKKKPKKERSWHPSGPGFHDLKGRQGWHLKEATESYQDWCLYKDGRCMETRRFYRPRR